MPNFPLSGTYLQAIRDSSKSLSERAGIQITHESIQRLLLSPAFTTSFKRVSSYHGLTLPLNFSSPLDELNVISVLSLLNFASGYRTQLHSHVRRGAWATIRALVFSMYISASMDEGDLLSAKGMALIRSSQVAELMGVSLHVERADPLIPGLTIGELGGPMHDLANLITAALNETGQILVRSGYPNLGAFIAEALKEGSRIKETRGDVQLDTVLERIVLALPPFQDMAEVGGQPIYCFKKALFLIHALAIRFTSSSITSFPIPSTTQSPIFADNVLPSMLIHLGVIDLSSSPQLSSLFPDAKSPEIAASLLGIYGGSGPQNESAQTEGPILTSDQAYTLRAAAIHASELIIQVARSLPEDILAADGSLNWIRNISLPELDMWLWAVAKDRPDYRKLPRFALKNTMYF